MVFIDNIFVKEGIVLLDDLGIAFRYKYLGIYICQNDVRCKDLSIWDYSDGTKSIFYR
jgi:hypothetical protein